MASSAYHQYGNSGPGTQNNNSGSGSQYNAQIINFNAARDNQDSLLTDLRVTEPTDDKVRIEDSQGGLWRDSYRWILDNPDFVAWRNTQGGRLLWIRGDPGKGKTMLLCGLINELESMGDEPVYFFCQATDSRLNTANAVLRGLLYMLLLRRPSLTSFVREKHERAGQRLFQDTNSWTALYTIFIELLAKTDHKLNNIVVVIDALDECTTNLNNLLDFIVKLSATSTKIVVSSRNWPEIEEIISKAERNHPLCLELNPEAVSAAVLEYINHKVEALSTRKRYDKKLREEVSSYLESNSDGTFLWVALVSHQLADPRLPKFQTRKRLREFPRGLDAIYDRMLDTVMDSDGVDLCKRILAITSLVFRPISLVELAYFTDYSDEFMDDLSSLKDMVERCGGILTIRGDVVRLVHQSAKEFLMTKAYNTIIPAGVDHEHHFILSRSIQNMANTLRRNIYGLQSPFTLIDEVIVPHPNPLEPVQYAITYWARHLRGDTSTTSQALEQICDFLIEHYLGWLEASSLLRSMFDGISCIYRLNSIAEVSAVPDDFSDVFRDARRYILYHGDGIRQSPLYAYTALGLTPKRSVVRDLFWHERPQWLQINPSIEDEWNACLHTIEPFASCRTSEIAIHPRGKIIASAGTSSYIQIWDAVTGELQKTLKAYNDRLYPLLAFSSTGDILAFGSGRKIELWDVDKSQVLRTLECHENLGSPMDNIITCLTFSPLSVACTLATGSVGRTVQLWDITTGRRMWSAQSDLPGWESGQTTHAVAFSEDGKQLVSAAEDIITIWDINKGSCLKGLRAQNEGRVMLVAFSQDASRVHSVSGRGVFRTWDRITGQCLQRMMLERLGAAVDGMALSHNQEMVAISLTKNIIELRSLKTSCVVGTLPQKSTVRSLQFSPDDTTLVTAAEEEGIKVWDIFTASNAKSFQNRSDDVMAMAISSDGAKLVSISLNGARVWDTGTGQCLEPSGASLHFSAAQLAVTFADGTFSRAHITHGQSLDIWQWSSRQLGSRRWTCIYTIHMNDRGPHRFQHFSFSSDGSQLSFTLAPRGVHFCAQSGDVPCSPVTLLTSNLKQAKRGSCHLYGEHYGDSAELKQLNVSRTGTERLLNYVESGGVTLTLTEQAATDLTTKVPEDGGAKVPKYSIQDKSWIMKDDKRIFWLPSEYRTSTFVARGQMIALGLVTGNVLFLRFA